MKLPVWCRVGGYRPEPLSRLRASVAPAGGSRWINRIVAAGILICFGAIGSAAEPNRAADRTRLHAYLEAGEFGPSLRLALAQPSAAGRNAMIAQIAVAQARAGAASAALVTLGELRDETLLRQTTAAISAIQGGPPSSSLADRALDVTAPANLYPATGGASGGGSNADFTSLIELITATVAPDSWDVVGGPGAVVEFNSGVYVDSLGVLKRLAEEPSAAQLGRDEPLARVRHDARFSDGKSALASGSKLRKISLPRLERALQVRAAGGWGPDEAMQNMAGIREIQYLFVYPESKELVIAGPAGSWDTDSAGRSVGNGGQPILQLDDFVVLLRNAFSNDGQFGCSIDPKTANLAATQRFLAASTARPFRSSAERTRWLEKLRSTVGTQDVEVYGIDARTHVAQTIVAADYHMKLVGMGLEPAAGGASSYLNLVQLGPHHEPPPMTLLRWWFTLDYDALQANADRTAFALSGRGVKVLSENELLADQGKRVPTGQADEWNQAFASSFTEHYDAFCQKYPVYAELRQVFDTALIAGLLRAEGLLKKADWSAGYFLQKDGYQVATGRAPREVESVVNHRLINGRVVVAGVSGGVMVRTAKFVRRLDDSEQHGLKAAYDQGAVPGDGNSWWWD